MRRARDSRRPWTPAWIRAVAAFVALLVAGDHGLASLHQALTAHEVCADHGELVHPASTHFEATRDSELGVEQGATAEAEHHHCGAVPAAPTRAPVVAASEPIAAPPLALVASSEAFEGSAPTADVLAYAPKQSPPLGVA